MRPVNLIPPEERRGDRAPLRAGSMSYVLVGAAAAALVAVLALVFTQNSITNKENEIAQLEVTRDAAAQRAQSLAPYAQFASLQQQRELTIASLAQSRFDWERVLRELALVIPGNVTLESLDAATAGEGDSSGDPSAASPTLKMTGCAPTHDDVAVFVAALEDIDGLTRVGLENSTKGTSDSSSGEDAAACPPKATSFALSAVFDGFVPADPAAATTPAPAPESAPAKTESAETNSTEEQLGEAEKATNLVPGTAR